MKWTIHKTEEQPFIKIITEGDFNPEDHLKMVMDIVSSDFWKPGMNVLFDNRNLHFDFSDVSSISEAVNNHFMYDEKIGNGKSAILMNSVSDYGRGLQFELFGEGKLSTRLEIFLNEKGAIDWLTS